MSDPTLRVYVDSSPVDVPHSAVAIDAVTIANPDLAQSIRSGQNRVTDSRGLPIDTDTPLHGGFIMRVVPVRKAED
ncbi:MAG TPA: hypothetical protein VM099_03795 [Gemmatimonadaceae bacterium]|nr:hypothetical protein [Gemmatimonadaceae bacterium]